MESKFDNQKTNNNKKTELIKFYVPLSLDEVKTNISISLDHSNEIYKHQLLTKAREFQQKGSFREAEKFYQYFLDQGFNDPKVFSNYGVILKELGKLDEAELSLRKAIKLKPDFAEAYSNLGGVLNDLEKFEEAELFIRKAIEIKHDYSTAHYNLGNILKNRGKLKESESSLRKAIKYKSDYFMAYSNLGAVLTDLGKLEEAEFLLLKAIELKPDYAKAYYSLSNLKYSNNRKKWESYLFSESILNNKSKKDQIDIHFARANILH